MNISSDLISQFVKITDDTAKPKKESTVYGTVKEYNDAMYVQMDGSDLLTPIADRTTSALSPGERVIVTIKNHTATVTGNLSSPAARWVTDDKGKKSVEGTLSAGELTIELGKAASSATNYLKLSADGLVIADMTSKKLGNNVIIGTDSVKIRNGSIVNAVFGADVIDLAKDNESATISMLNGAFKIYYDSDNSDGGFGVYGKAPDGKDRLAFQPVNENGNTTLGWGNYAANNGNTNIYGDDVHIGVSYGGTIKQTFRPYYRAGDSFSTQFRGCGYITSGGKALRFSIPLSKPVIGTPKVTVTSSGFTLRQGGKYTHGSSDSSTVQPTTIEAVLDGSGNFVRISAEFDDITNVINNDGIGIDWGGTITFSKKE